MMIIRIALYKDRFDVYVTNAGDIMIRIVLNRREFSGQDRLLHAFEGGGGGGGVRWRCQVAEGAASGR
jgi:hypothetical protein